MIPVEMQAFRQWVMWRHEKDANGKPTKVPYHAPTGQHASTTDPTTWVDYANAVAAMQTGQYSGIGFVFTATDPFTGIDLDNPYKDVLFADAQVIATRHSRILAMMDSYSEWSPSGTGIHIIVKGKINEGRKRAKVEIYSHSRFFTMTGNTYLNKPIADRSDILPAFHAEMGKPKTIVTITESTETESDYAIYEKMMRAENGDKALATWNGEWQGIYASHSDCDIALVNMLQWYTHNTKQIERMFKASPCAHRLVTGEKHKYAKYIPQMIQKSFDRELPDLDFSQLRASVATLPQVPAEAPAAVAIETPKQLWTLPPGLIGEIASYIYQQAPLPVQEYSLAAAFALMAGICGRAYNVSDEGLNLYMLVLGLTGTGKEQMAKGIGKLLQKVEVLAPAASEFRGPAEIASGPALTKKLVESPCCFSILGEFGLRLHQLCNEQAQSHMIGLRRILLDLFHKSGRGGEVRPHIYSDKDKNTEVLHSPAYTILGESTPETFYRYLDESMLSDGLMPRFLVLEYEGDRVDLNRGFAAVEPTEQLVKKVADLATFCHQMHHSNRVLPCAFGPGAEALYWELADYYAKLIRQQSRTDPVARQLYNRAHLKAMKLAALIAVGVDPINPTITVEHIRWAHDMEAYGIKAILHKFQVGKVGRETGDMNQVSEMVNIIKDFMTREFDATMKKYNVPLAMKQANVIPFQYLSRQCNGRACFRQDRIGAQFAINRAVQTLIYEGGLREVKATQLAQEFNTTMKAYAIVDPTMFS